MMAKASESAADAAAARGDYHLARTILEQVTGSGTASPAAWVKLASMRRALGLLPAALVAVDAALKHDPLDFVALLLRADLLHALGGAEAGAAYGRAVAQRPDGVLPPALTRQLAVAEARFAAHTSDYEARLAAATSLIDDRADPIVARRLERFRSNVARRTEVFHSQPTAYHYPGLVEREFHERADHPWLLALEAATEAIAADFARVAAAERTELVPYVEYADGIPLRQWAGLNRSRGWTAIHLLRRGEPVVANTRHCAATMAVLATLPQPHIRGKAPNAMFSLLAPRTSIPPHTGVANTRLIVHLPLIVPPGCWFRVGAETRQWRRGEAFVFDDTIEHTAGNDSDELRAVLIFDVWHPGLAAVERDGVAAAMAIGESDGVDGL